MWQQNFSVEAGVVGTVACSGMSCQINLQSSSVQIAVALRTGIWLVDPRGQELEDGVAVLAELAAEFASGRGWSE